MTKQQLNKIVRVCGENFEESDVPAMWRIREKVEELKQTLEEELEISMDYPLGAMIEPYDIEREKESR